MMGAWNLEEKSKGKDSYWYEFLKSQPGTEEFPIFYNEEEMANMKGSPFVKWLRDEIEE